MYASCSRSWNFSKKTIRLKQYDKPVYRHRMANVILEGAQGFARSRTRSARSQPALQRQPVTDPGQQAAQGGGRGHHRVGRALLPGRQPLLQLGTQCGTSQMQHQLGVEQQRARIQIEAAEQRLLLPTRINLACRLSDSPPVPTARCPAVPTRDGDGDRRRIPAAHPCWPGVGQDVNVHPACRCCLSRRRNPGSG